MTKQDFYRDFVSQSIPLIFKNGCTDWAVYRSLNASALDDFMGAMFQYASNGAGQIITFNQLELLSVGKHSQVRFHQKDQLNKEI